MPGPAPKPYRRTPTYKSWQSMKQRCSNPSAPDYDRYGGRGISYDPRWEDFDTFLTEMGPRPEGMTLDRIHNDGNYSKDNCRWADKLTQAQNRNIQNDARSDSSTGIRGVSKEKFGCRFKVEIKHNGIRTVLYRGKDFFEACCARKSYEINHRN